MENMSDMDRELLKLSQDVGQVLLHSEMRLVTAESCTGGGIAAAITEIAGSSTWLEAGFVTYSNEAKVSMLGVLTPTLEEHGAVSEQVAIQMAEGALVRSRANMSVSVSGVAGPDGGSEDKPVGTVWMAWAVRGRETITRLFAFAGDRQSVRQQAVVAALKGIQGRLQN